MIVVVDEAPRDQARVLGRLGRAHGPAEHDVLVDRHDLDVLLRHEAVEGGAQGAEVELDADLEVQDLAPLAVEKEDVGVADLFAEDVGRAR